MSNGGNNRQDGMEPADDEALWRLLGRARTPETSPYFSRRVLRETARLDDPRGAGTTAGAGLGGWLARCLRRPGAALWPGVAAVAVFWLSVELTIPAAMPGGAGRHARSQTAPLAGETARVAASSTVGSPGETVAADAEGVAPQDVEVIADLDNMIAREEDHLWTEDTARF